MNAKLTAANVKLASTQGVTGVAPNAEVDELPLFPHSLGPLVLVASANVSLKVVFPEKGGMGRYTVTGGLALPSIPGQERSGLCSPAVKLPGSWPGAPANAATFCWAFPVEAANRLQQVAQLAFLSLTTEARMLFTAYGGFVFFDQAGAVISLQAVKPVIDESDALYLAFSNPRPWRKEYTDALISAGRFQPVTVPHMLAAGAMRFCWVSPGEELQAGPERWTPSVTGAYVYLDKAGGSLGFFPAELDSAPGAATIVA